MIWPTYVIKWLMWLSDSIEPRGRLDVLLFSFLILVGVIDFGCDMIGQCSHGMVDVVGGLDLLVGLI